MITDACMHQCPWQTVAMSDSVLTSLDASTGNLALHCWPHASPSWIAVLVHGYGEHLGRYGHVADRLHEVGAIVYGADHIGHGRSPGERVLIEDFEPVVDDVQLVVHHAREQHPGLPTVVIGHSMGGMIAARYGQRFGRDLTALVLSGPVLGSWQATDLADLAEIPDEPLDVSTLSRDPHVGDAYDADALVWHGPFKRPTLRAFAAEIDVINAGGRLGLLPTLWVHGEGDQIVPIEPTREGIARIRGAAFAEHTFPGARHEVFNETNSAEVLDTVVAFALEHV